MTYSLCLSPCSSAAAVAAPAVVSPALRVFAAPASSSAPAPAVVWLPAAPVVATHKYTGYWMVPGIRQRERELVLQLTFKCSCSWTSCCLVSTSCFFWNSANSSCFCSSCCCLRRMSSCWSCCSLMAVSTTAPPDTDPTLGSVRRSTGPPPPPGLSPGLPPGNVKNNMASTLAKCTAELLILYICSLIWITAFFPFPNY